MAALLLLGAGASYGSNSEDPPPRGFELFDAIEKRIGLPKNFPADLKAVFRQDFEVGMAAYFERTRGDVSDFQCRMAELLASYAPGPKNVYVKLIATLGIERVIYSTLNYDLLFELAAEILGMPTTYSSTRLPGAARLLKPHGSCNFWPDLGGGSSFAGNKFINCKVHISAPIKILNAKQTIESCKKRDSLSPAMSIYALGKNVQICPEMVLDQQRQWGTCVQNTSNIFVVGVRINMNDPHIWERLGKSSAPTTCFGVSDQDALDFEKWRDRFQKRNAYFVKANFEDSVEIIAQRLRRR